MYPFPVIAALASRLDEQEKGFSVGGVQTSIHGSPIESEASTTSNIPGNSTDYAAFEYAPPQSHNISTLGRGSGFSMSSLDTCELWPPLGQMSASNTAFATERLDTIPVPGSASPPSPDNNPIFDPGVASHLFTPTPPFARGESQFGFAPFVSPEDIRSYLTNLVCIDL